MSLPMKKENKIFNPFEGRDRDQVWKEISEQGVPTTREEAFRKMRELARQKKKK
jgi:hypothetical protein